MGLFSKKKPKETTPAADPAQPPKAMPSLGLPANTPTPLKPGEKPTLAVVPSLAPAPAVAPVAAPVVAAPVAAPAASSGEPETYVLADVTLEETGFIESPNSGTGSMSLVVSEPDPEPAKPASAAPAPVAAAPVAVPTPAAPVTPAAQATPSISLVAPGAESGSSISLVMPDTAAPSLSLAAAVTEIATPGTAAPAGVAAPGAAVPAAAAPATAASPVFKPPKITLDPQASPVAAAPVAAPVAAAAAPTPEGLKSQVIQARAFRVVVTPLHRLKFLPSEPILKGKEEAHLSNISTSGVGLVTSDFIQPPVLKAVFVGSLIFESGSHPVELEVMHVTSGVIGCRFVGEKVDGLREAIKTYFELELLALGMLKVNPAHHKAEADGTAHWIHGDQCELFYVTDAANKLVRFRLTFLGNRFVWSKAGGLNLGQVIDDRVGIMRTDRIAVMEMTPEISELALRFLHNIPQVPQEHREQIGNAISPGYVLKPEPGKAP